jgi:hypothetical protein
MATVNVTAKDPSLDRSVTVAYNFGENLDEAVAMFGAEAVFNAFVADAKVGLQALIRSKIRGTKDKDGNITKSYNDEEIQAAANEWKPAAGARQAADPMAKLKALLEKLTPEQRAAVLAGE